MNKRKRERLKKNKNQKRILGMIFTEENIEQEFLHHAIPPVGMTSVYYGSFSTYEPKHYEGSQKWADLIIVPHTSTEETYHRVLAHRQVIGSIASSIADKFQSSLPNDFLTSALHHAVKAILHHKKDSIAKAWKVKSEEGLEYIIALHQNNLMERSIFYELFENIDELAQKEKVDMSFRFISVSQIDNIKEDKTEQLDIAA